MKEEVMASFKTSRHLTGSTEEKHEHRNESRRSLGRHLGAGVRNDWMQPDVTQRNERNVP